jgi:hypothetical protein
MVSFGTKAARSQVSLRSSSGTEQAKAKYHYTVEPLSVNARYGEIVVIGKAAGDKIVSPEIR